jgi:hypothetical protein
MRAEEHPMTRFHLLVAVLGLAIGVTAGIAIGQTQSADEGRKFFYDNVLPALAKNGCPTCHAVGYMHPNVTVYEELLRRLAIGDSPTNNAVVYKIANLRSIAPDRPNHPGGQRCATVAAEPCATIQRWWTIEFGNSLAKAGGRHD